MKMKTLRFQSVLRPPAAAFVFGAVAAAGCRPNQSTKHAQDESIGPGGRDTGGNTSGRGSVETKGSDGASKGAGGGTTGANTPGGTMPDTTGTDTGGRSESSGGTPAQPNEPGR